MSTEHAKLLFLGVMFAPWALACLGMWGWIMLDDRPKPRQLLGTANLNTKE